MANIKKPVDLEALSGLVEVFPTKEQVTQQITDAGLSGETMTFATREEVVALFNATTVE